jgi:hypothetical protein
MSRDFAFPTDTIAFLADLRAHNDKVWFDANRARYEAAYVEPATALVEAVAGDLDAIVPGIRADPRVLGSIFRIHRDTRFSTDKRPYKDHLDFWFWEGDRKKAVSGLFLRVSPDGIVIGAGAHGFAKDRLARYRDAAADPSAGGTASTTCRSGASIQAPTRSTSRSTARCSAVSRSRSSMARPRRHGEGSTDFNARSKKHVSLLFHTGASIPGDHPRLAGGEVARSMSFADLADVEAAAIEIRAVTKAWCDSKD